MSAPYALGVTTDETDMSSAEVRSNSTRNEEPTLGVVNLEHAAFTRQASNI